MLSRSTRSSSTSSTERTKDHGKHACQPCIKSAAFWLCHSLDHRWINGEESGECSLELPSSSLEPSSKDSRRSINHCHSLCLEELCWDSESRLRVRLDRCMWWRFHIRRTEVWLQRCTTRSGSWAPLWPPPLLVVPWQSIQTAPHPGSFRFGFNCSSPVSSSHWSFSCPSRLAGFTSTTGTMMLRTCSLNITAKATLTLSGLHFRCASTRSSSSLRAVTSDGGITQHCSKTVPLATVCSATSWYRFLVNGLETPCCRTFSLRFWGQRASQTPRRRRISTWPTTVSNL